MTEQKFDRDTWQTPDYFFRWLNERFHFDLDGCATDENYLDIKNIEIGFHSICENPATTMPFIGNGSEIATDFLKNDLDSVFRELSLRNLSIFVNPPYSDVTPFIQQAKRLRDAGHTVVMLLNNDKSTQWYQNHIHNVANEVIDITGSRIAFIHPVTGEEVKGNSKGQMVVVFDPTMEDFVQRSVSLDFIKKVGGYE
ncbi:DNA N-6-adenine-methyltransferase [[Pasteurella] aerogenes]